MQCIPHSVHSFKWKKVEIEHNQTEINITKLSLIHLYLHVLYTTHHIDIFTKCLPVRLVARKLPCQ